MQDITNEKMVKIKTQVQLNKKKFKTSITALIDIIWDGVLATALWAVAKNATCLCMIDLHNISEVQAFHIELMGQRCYICLVPSNCIIAVMANALK